jgi:hypothetical protein
MRRIGGFPRIKRPAPAVVDSTRTDSVPPAAAVGEAKPAAFEQPPRRSGFPRLPVRPAVASARAPEPAALPAFEPVEDVAGMDAFDSNRSGDTFAEPLEEDPDDAPIIETPLQPLLRPMTVLPPTPPDRGARPPVRQPGSGLLALNGGAPAPAKPNLGFLPPPPRERLPALSSPAPRPTGGYAKAPPAPTPVPRTTAPPPVQPGSGLLSPRPLPPPLPDARVRAASAPRPGATPVATSWSEPPAATLPRVSMHDAAKLPARRPPLAPETPRSGTLTADDIPF